MFVSRGPSYRCRVVPSADERLSRLASSPSPPPSCDSPDIYCSRRCRVHLSSLTSQRMLVMM